MIADPATPPDSPDGPSLPPLLWREEVIRGHGLPGILMRTIFHREEGFELPPYFQPFEGIAFVVGPNNTIQGEVRFPIPGVGPGNLAAAVAAYPAAFKAFSSKQAATARILDPRNMLGPHSLDRIKRVNGNGRG